MQQYLSGPNLPRCGKHHSRPDPSSHHQKYHCLHQSWSLPEEFVQEATRRTNLVDVTSTKFFLLCILPCLTARLLAGLCMSLSACSPLVLTWTSALYRTPMVCRGRRDMSTCRNLAAPRYYLRFWGLPKSVIKTSFFTRGSGRCLISPVKDLSD